MTASALLERVSGLLRAEGVPEAEANAEFLLSHALGCGRMETRVWPHRTLTRGQVRLAMRLARRRARREPLAYVLGSQPFLELTLRATPAALVPRPETEELVEAVSELMRAVGARARVLEVGTGTGCISIALAARFKSAFFRATDISPAALRLARLNARRNRLQARIRFSREDLFHPRARAAKPWVDVLVSNPPYIPSARIAALEPEVLHEPQLALDGGEDGLDAIRALAALAARELKPGGWLAFEFGRGQGTQVRSILKGFDRICIRKDFAGLDRFALAQRPKNRPAL